MRRLDLSGASLLEMRLRLDMVNLAVPYIGGTEQPSLSRLIAAPDMQPYRGRRGYDEPLPRRLAEEAGVERGSFAVEKRAASVRLHRHGLAAMSASGRRSFEAFAGAAALASLPARAPFGRRHRLALRIAGAIGRPGLVADIERRRRESVHFEPRLGTLLLRWAVEQLRPRYAELG